MWWLYDTIDGAVLRKVAIGLLVVVIGLYVLFPLYWTVMTSFKTMAELQQIPPTIFPANPSLEGFTLVVMSSIQAGGYSALVENTLASRCCPAIDINVLELVLNSLKVATGAGLIAVVLGIGASYILSRREFCGKNSLMSLLLASLMFPGTAIMVPSWELISTLGL